MELRNIDTHMQKNEIGILSCTMPKTQNQLKAWLQTAKLLEENTDANSLALTLAMTHFRYDAESSANKSKNGKVHNKKMKR
jgi:hypothetical protein